jgi:hypothetical protein
MCIDGDGAGVSGSDDGLRVFRESDVGREDNGSDNGMLDEAFDEDMHTEGIADGVDGVLQGDNSVGGFVELLQQCRNCCRKKILAVEDREPYSLQLELYESAHINTHLKFCLFRRRDVQGQDKIVLCCECASFLVRGVKQEMNNVWPAFVWSVLRTHF